MWLTTKDIEDHYLAMMELDEDPRFCTERLIRTFGSNIHNRINCTAALDAIADGEADCG